jgi:cold shock CspA family protein
MAESFNKKERERKKQQIKKLKTEKRQERKNNISNGNKPEIELAYVDENGNLSSTPPDPSKRIEINIEDIALGVPKQVMTNDENDTMQGIVKFYNEAKGYGFIKDLNSQKEYFVHLNNVIDKIGEKSKVSFETQRSPKGEYAINVRLIK